MWIFSDAIKGGVLLEKAIEESKRMYFHPYPFTPPPLNISTDRKAQDKEKRENNE